MVKTRRFWLGLVVSLTFLILLLLFVIHLNWREIASALKQANYLLLLPGIALYFFAVLFRTWRWKYLLSPLRSLPSGRLFPVVVVGYMANNLLPVRLGEVVRSYYLGEREGVSKAATLSTVIVERVYDGLVLLFFLAVSALFLPWMKLVNELGETYRYPVPGWLLVAVMALPFVVAIALLVGMAMYPRMSQQLIRKVTSRSPRGIGSTLERLVERFLEGLAVLRSPQRLVRVFLLSLPVWLMEGAMYYVIALAFDLQGEFTSLAFLGAVMLAVTATSNLATSLPSLPGGLGLFEGFAIATLVFLGAGDSLASAYVVVLHLTLLVPVTVAGLLYLWRENLSLAQLTRKGMMKATLRTE